MNIMQNCNKPPVNMRRTLRLLDGGMPMNTTPMSGQDMAALGNMQNTMVSMQSTPAAPTPAAPAPVATPAVATPIAKPTRSPGKVAAADYSLPGNTFSPMAVPQLRDGGEVSPWSMRGIIKNVSKAFEKTPEQKQQEYAQRLAEAKARMAAREAAAAPAPAQPARETAAPMGSQSVLDRRMAAAGLRDGGEISLWGRVKSALTPTPQTPEQAQHARDLAEYKARAAAARSAPAPAAQPAPAAHALTQYGNGDATAARMKAAGLQDGGTVPGKGTGDKIPALYEPGEFVVSNAMLDAAPQLREQLHDLRGNVLARQGKSVEQADAEAVGGKTLRAANGVATDWTSRALQGQRMTPTPTPMQSVANSLSTPQPAPVAAPQASKYTPPPVDPTTGRYAHGTQNGTPQQGPRGGANNSGVGVSGGSGAGSTNLAGGAGRTLRAGVSLEPTAGGLIRDKLLGTSKDWGKVGELAGKARNLPGVGLAGTLLKGVAAPVSAYQTYQDVDKGDYGSAAVHGVDTAAGAALFTPAMPAAAAYLGARTAYEAPQMLRDELGESGLDAVGGTINQIGLRSGLWGTDDSTHLASKNPNTPQNPTTPKYTPRPDSVAPWGNESRRQLANINAPSGNVRGIEDFSKALSTVPKDLPAGLRDGMVYKTKGANGETVYSGRNISGDVNGRMLNGDGTSAGPMRGSVETSAGAPVFGGGGYAVDNNAPTGAAKQAQINATLRNPDGSTWTARDNAVMAANLRDGVDPYRGTSRQSQNDEHAQVRALANSPVGTIGRRGAMKRLSEIEQNQTTLRGQDQEMERAKLTAQSTLRKNEFDMQRDLRTDTRAQEAHNQTVGDKAREGLAKEFMVYDTDKDGRQVANPKASTESLDALRAILPGMTSTDPKTREAALSDAKAMHRIFLEARKQDPVGWDAMKFWESARPELSGMPDAMGSSTEQLSGMDGLMTVNAENGDTILRQKDGRKINLGQLDARQRKLLEAAQQRGWGK